MKKLAYATWLFWVMTYAATAQAKAEFQIFMNYRGPNQYDYKVVSTTENAVSAWYINPPTQNAACFKGDPEEALALFNVMVGIYNAEYERNVQATGYPEFDSTTGTTSLVINQIDETGHRWTWFPRMRECMRWSTEQERWPTR